MWRNSHTYVEIARIFDYIVEIFEESSAGGALGVAISTIGIGVEHSRIDRKGSGYAAPRRHTTIQCSRDEQIDGSRAFVDDSILPCGLTRSEGTRNERCC